MESSNSIDEPETRNTETIRDETQPLLNQTGKGSFNALYKVLLPRCIGTRVLFQIVKDRQSSCPTPMGDNIFLIERGRHGKGTPFRNSARPKEYSHQVRGYPLDATNRHISLTVAVRPATQS